MNCPKCEISMEEYALESTKIVYRNNDEDTKLRMSNEVFVCPECKMVVGTVRDSKVNNNTNM